MESLRLTWRHEASGLEMAFVEGTHGRPYSFGEEAAKLLIEVPDFFIASVVVTNDLWAYVMQEEIGGQPQRHLPKLEVSWDMITAPDGFLDRLNNSEILTAMRAQAPAAFSKGRFRLPSETEWEYAARGGPHWRDGFRFSGSDDIELVGWYQLNSSDRNHEVGLKAPNQLGLYDMSGNVWEWCQDTYTSDVSRIPLDGSARTGGDSDDRCLRGGCHHNWAIHCTVSKRYEISRQFHDGCIGFRLAFG